MKQWRTSTAFKALCGLLCCLFFAGAVGTAAYEVWNWSKIDGFNPQYSRELYGKDVVAGSSLIGEYRLAAVEHWENTQKTKLNVDEQRKQKLWKTQMNPDSTNFRYRIYNLNGLFLDSNVDSSVSMDNVNSSNYLVGIVQDSDGVYSYDTEATVKSENHDFNELLNDYYRYNEETQSYSTVYDSSEYEERYENWRTHCNDTAAMEERKQELIAEQETEGVAFEEGKEPITSGQPQSIPCDDIDFENDYYDEEAQTLCYLDVVQERYVSAALIAPPEGNWPKLVGVMEWGLLKGLPNKDDLQTLSLQYQAFQRQIPGAVIGIIALSALCIAAFVLLLMGSGHKEGVDGIYVAVFHKCPLDVLAVVELSALVILAAAWKALVIASVQMGALSEQSAWQVPLTCGVAAALAAAVALPFCTTWAVQAKEHSCLGRTLIGRLWGLCSKTLVLLLRNLRGLGLAPKAALGCSAYGLAVVFFASQLWRSGLNAVILLLLALAGLGALGWWLKGWEKIETSAQHIAQGELHYQTDTEHMPWDLKQHAQQLNAISEGMQRAVEEQMKSDRFRTELITNVSHDLKTPLTSIISYVDLLKKLELPEEQAQEYLEVLDRKSQRLKTLTEDLVEASKAAAGVLPVELERLDASLVLTQALGEYQERLDKAELSVVVQKPEEPVWICSDGHHLWRILDNLLSNCAKYAMKGTRVYVTLEEQGTEAVITVKNISAQPLNVPVEELMERFVRGDSSRTNEGSGLGLSIAQSLAVMQGAKFRIGVDGDLFKAELRFPVAE